MKRSLVLLVVTAIFGLSGCEENMETPLPNEGMEFQPLEIGFFWIYEIEQTIYFAENDSENRTYFLRDFIRSSYLNASKELVFVVDRSVSEDKKNWTKTTDYTLLIRDRVLVRTIDNQALVALVFPPRLGQVWNAKIYQAGGQDDFEIDQADGRFLRVNQEELDDKITIRDMRYEIFEKNVGLKEKRMDVVTYCSRIDCLGKQTIDSGQKIYMKLVDYGKN
jgi:hypothetical protein